MEFSGYAQYLYPVSKQGDREGIYSNVLHHQLIRRGETHRPPSVILSEAKDDKTVLEQVSSSLHLYSMVQLDQ